MYGEDEENSEITRDGCKRGLQAYLKLIILFHFHIFKLLKGNISARLLYDFFFEEFSQNRLLDTE